MRGTLPGNDIKAIIALQDEWLQRERTGKPETLIDLCTDDVVLLPPRHPPVVGRTAVGKWLQQPAAELISVNAEIIFLRGDENTAYKLAHFTSSFREALSGEPQRVSGTHLWVLERNPTGTWRVALVSWILHN